MRIWMDSCYSDDANNRLKADTTSQSPDYFWCYMIMLVTSLHPVLDQQYILNAVDG